MFLRQSHSSGNAVLFSAASGYCHLTFLCTTISGICKKGNDHPTYYGLFIYGGQQFPSSVRAFHQSLTVRYRQGTRWWSAVELARRLLFLLFIVIFPDNEVGYSITERT